MSFKMREPIVLPAGRLGAKKIRLYIGYRGSDRHYSGASMADLAAMLSAGTAKIPARPHLTEGIEFSKPLIEKEIAKTFGGFVKNLLVNKNERKLDVEKIKQLCIDGIKAYVNSGFLEPNAPSTVRKKGRNQPLINTYELVDHIVAFEE